MCSEFLSQRVFLIARWLKRISKPQFFGIPKYQNLEIHQILSNEQEISNEFSGIPRQTEHPSEILGKNQGIC